jgi:hypothetical protein
VGPATRLRPNAGGNALDGNPARGKSRGHHTMALDVTGAPEEAANSSTINRVPLASLYSA